MTHSLFATSIPTNIVPPRECRVALPCVIRARVFTRPSQLFALVFATKTDSSWRWDQNACKLHQELDTRPTPQPFPMSILRRLRGLLGLSLAGAIIWIPLGLATVVIDAWIRGLAVQWRVFPQHAVQLFITGAACGVLFGLILFAMDRRRSFSGLTLGRTALWGALGGLTIPTFLFGSGIAHAAVAQIGTFAMFAGLGATMSAGALAVARRAPSLPLRATPAELPDVSP